MGLLCKYFLKSQLDLGPESEPSDRENDDEPGKSLSDVAILIGT